MTTSALVDRLITILHSGEFKYDTHTGIITITGRKTYVLNWRSFLWFKRVDIYKQWITRYDLVYDIKGSEARHLVRECKSAVKKYNAMREQKRLESIFGDLPTIEPMQLIKERLKEGK